MDDALPRHSLLYLSGPLKAAGFEVELADLRFLSNWADFDDKLRTAAPDYVCVTAHTQEEAAALDCCRRAKRLLPSVITVVGGIHFTMYPEKALGSGVVDFVVRGEGELTLPKMLLDPASAEQVSWGEVPNLDSIPFEDRDLYPDYARTTGFPLWDLPRPIIDLVTKRGCPWQCRFCCGPGEQNLYTKPARQRDGRRLPTFRHRSVGNVLDEMELLYERYRFKGVVFHDDQFVIRTDWADEFCEAMHERGFVDRGIRWWAASRADVICRHPGLIEKMRDAGLQIVSIGFESFSDPMLEWMRKDTTVRENFEAARICHELGLEIFANVIFGTPRGDGRWRLADDIASVEAIRQIRPRYFSPSYFSPIPGSWLHQWSVSEGLVLDDEPQVSGSRNPNGPRMRGIDYEEIEPLLSELEVERCRVFRPERKSMLQRLKDFSAKPIADKKAAIGRRLGVGLR